MNSPDCTGESTSRSSGTGENKIVLPDWLMIGRDVLNFHWPGSVRVG